MSDSKIAGLAGLLNDIGAHVRTELLPPNSAEVGHPGMGFAPFLRARVLRGAVAQPELHMVALEMSNDLGGPHEGKYPTECVQCAYDLGRNTALEEAARVAEGYYEDSALVRLEHHTAHELARAIRALKSTHSPIETKGPEPRLYTLEEVERAKAVAENADLPRPLIDTNPDWPDGPADTWWRAFRAALEGT